ncbi:hypothetical protein [Ramlibacter albus]|uniref:DUF2946 domain-containing protein n=1 Tax=Ramlibacter albus TaxID=2079448 RepID=A0A923M9Q8_9BURK|nr:hypothetical protein [Ramlibacter albus]MBC5765955.1 hypothetical protein [Ramlibacter albus]
MRIRMILLLVAALLFKGWVGEAMAGQMLAQQLDQAVAAQAMHADCPGHAAHEDGKTNPASCEQCQACSLHALPAMPVLVAGAAPRATPAQAAIHFTSAEPRPTRKPPVS